MNNIIRQRRKVLARALTSGEYDQGTGQLCFQGRLWCALGVACQVYSNSLLEAPRWDIDEEGVWSYAGDALQAPQEVRDWFGIDDDEYRAIQRRNDELGWNFESIAHELTRGAVA